MGILSPSQDIKSFRLFGICFFLIVLNGYFFQFMASCFFPDLQGAPFTEKDSKVFVLAAGCLFGPLLETLLFQVLPNQILTRTGINNIYVLWIFPALLFGAFHHYNLLYITSASLGGLIFNYLYLKSKSNPKHAFLSVALLHSLYNLYGFLLVK
eukprot:gene2810-3232_t